MTNKLTEFLKNLTYLYLIIGFSISRSEQAFPRHVFKAAASRIDIFLHQLEHLEAFLSRRVAVISLCTRKADTVDAFSRLNVSTAAAATIAGWSCTGLPGW